MPTNAAQVNRELADALINTRTLPPGLKRVQELAAQARAYHRLNPYPIWHFKDWSIDDRGPYPRCLPLPKRIVKRGALWLFGKPIQINVAGNATLEQYLRDGWDANRMPSRLRAIGEDAALDGGVAFKFSIDETQKDTFDIQTLSITDEVRLFYHPHNRDLLLMARVQYSFWDTATNRLMWYREEWTAEREVHYYPVTDEAINTARSTPDSYEFWTIDPLKSGVNPFKLIPIHCAKNLETDDTWGAGDLWSLEEADGLLRIIDRINLTSHLMDRSNQFDSQSNPYIVDGEPDSDEPEKPLQPNQTAFIKSTDPTGKQAQLLWRPTGNQLRPAMMDYAGDLKKQVLDAVNSVQLDQGEITNKGNLTTAVLEVIYAPQIDITTEKRKSMGNDGIAAFLSLAARGLQNAGVKLGVTASKDSHAVTLAWSDFFAPSEQEKTDNVTRTQTEEQAGYLPHDRAVERVAKMNGIEDVAKLKTEIAAHPPAPAPSNANDQAA